MLGHGAMFVVAQPGAGMHYAVPRVFADAAALQSFCTDISATPPHAPAGSHAKSMGGGCWPPSGKRARTLRPSHPL
jgi:hypothetical protein